MKPIILICGVYNLKVRKKEYKLHTSYVKAIREAGGIPILVPITNEIEEIKEYISMCDGILLPGGEDISPIYLNEEPVRGIGSVDIERDTFEFKLYKEAVLNKKTVLGICKGSQIIAVANNGSVYQDIVTQIPLTYEHSQPEEQLDEVFHSVMLEEDSILYKIFKKKIIKVNSWHHQAIKSVGTDLKITGKALDGVIEAVESKDGTVIGVQWHPELLIEKYPEQLEIYKYFIEKCKNK